MIKAFKKFIKVALVFTFVFACTATAYAYNTKFAFDLTSGMFSPWVYAGEMYKYTADENLVVECTYTYPSDATFLYDVVNSDDESRVVPFSATGTFIHEFELDTVVQNEMCRLRVKRESGSWSSLASTQGYWYWTP